MGPVGVRRLVLSADCRLALFNMPIELAAVRPGFHSPPVTHSLQTLCLPASACTLAVPAAASFPLPTVSVADPECPPPPGVQGSADYADPNRASFDFQPGREPSQSSEASTVPVTASATVNSADLSPLPGTASSAEPELFQKLRLDLRVMQLGDAAGSVRHSDLPGQRPVDEGDRIELVVTLPPNRIPRDHGDLEAPSAPASCVSTALTVQVQFQENCIKLGAVLAQHAIPWPWHWRDLVNPIVVDEETSWELCGNALKFDVQKKRVSGRIPEWDSVVSAPCPMTFALSEVKLQEIQEYEDAFYEKAKKAVMDGLLQTPAAPLDAVSPPAQSVKDMVAKFGQDEVVSVVDYGCQFGLLAKPCFPILLLLRTLQPSSTEPAQASSPREPSVASVGSVKGMVAKWDSPSGAEETEPPTEASTTDDAKADDPAEAESTQSPAPQTKDDSSAPGQKMENDSDVATDEVIPMEQTMKPEWESKSGEDLFKMGKDRFELMRHEKDKDKQSDLVMEGITLLRAAAINCTHWQAATVLVNLYQQESGEAVGAPAFKPSIATARALVHRFADEPISDKEAQRYVGYLYESGELRATPSFAKSLKYYQMAALQGEPSSMSLLANLLLNGEGTAWQQPPWKAVFEGWNKKQYANSVLAQQWLTEANERGAGYCHIVWARHFINETSALGQNLEQARKHCDIAGESIPHHKAKIPWERLHTAEKLKQDKAKAKSPPSPFKGTSAAPATRKGGLTMAELNAMNDVNPTEDELLTPVVPP
eukprot:gene691-2501_t